MKTKDSISKKRQELYKQLAIWQEKTPRTTEQSVFVKAEIAKLNKCLREIDAGRSKQIAWARGDFAK